MNFVSKMMNFALEMMDFVSKQMNSVSKMMDFVICLQNAGTHRPLIITDCLNHETGVVAPVKQAPAFALKEI